MSQHPHATGGGESFLLKFIIFIIVFILLITYVVNRNFDTLLVK